MADWSMLPNDLLELIVKRLETCFQIVLFRSVCSSWRSVAPRPDNSLGLGNKTHINFNVGLSFNDGEPLLQDEYCTLKKIPIFLIRFQTPFGGDFILAEIRARKYGKPMLMSSPLSCNGLTYERYEKLFNSLTSQIIPFGHYYEITYYEEEYNRYYNRFLRSKKVCQRAEFLKLDSEDCRDFAVLGRNIDVLSLVMFKSRNLSWTRIENLPKLYGSYQDIAAFNGKFYVVDTSGWGQVFAIKLSLEVTEILSVRGHEKSCQERLVKSGEELLLVQRFTPGYWCHREEMYTWFRVFRLDEGGGRRKWVQVNDLNDQVILLGPRINLCCSAHKLPGAKKNCIVFMDTYTIYNHNDWSESLLLFDLKTNKTSTAFSECRGYMGAFGANLESLVNCGVVTMPNHVKNVHDENFFIVNPSDFFENII